MYELLQFFLLIRWITDSSFISKILIYLNSSKLLIKYQYFIDLLLLGGVEFITSFLQYSHLWKMCIRLQSTLCYPTFQPVNEGYSFILTTPSPITYTLDYSQYNHHFTPFLHYILKIFVNISQIPKLVVVWDILFQKCHQYQQLYKYFPVSILRLQPLSTNVPNYLF